MIDIHFTLTHGEYTEAQALYNKKGRAAKCLKYTLHGVLTLSLGIVALTAPRASYGLILKQLAPVLVLLAVVLIGSPLLRKRVFKKRFELEKRNLTNAHVMLDDSGYHIQVPGTGSGIAEWTSMDGWVEGRTVILIRSGMLMRLLPKGALTDAQLGEVRVLLTSRVGPAGIIRKP